MNWEETEAEVKNLADKIDFQPDAIIAIVRGGLIPARLLSKYLNVKIVYALTVKKQSGQRVLRSQIKDELSGHKILLVEDILETGQSLKIAKDYLVSKDADVKTAALYIVPISTVKPDYFLSLKDKVITFPWD